MCTVCGYAVEWLRSCYSSEWRLFKGSPVAVKGRYFFAKQGTPHYPGWHNLGSRNWTSDERDPWPELGETATTQRPYSKGELRAGVPPAIRVGTADCIANGETLPLPVIVPPRTFIAGIDSRCYVAAGMPLPLDKVTTARGGGRDGGRSVIVVPRSSRPIGGTRTGGRSTGWTTAIHTFATGGSKEGGTSALVPSALPARGGSRGGGRALGQPQGAQAMAEGGAVDDGDATSSHSP